MAPLPLCLFLLCRLSSLLEPLELLPELPELPELLPPELAELLLVEELLVLVGCSGFFGI